MGVVFFTGHLDTFFLFHRGRSNAGFNTRWDQENSSYCASTMIRQQKLFQGFSLVTSCQGVRAEEVWASDHGEYNDAKSPPSLPPGGPAVPLPSQQPFHSPSPETLSCTCICFLQFQFSSFRAGNHVDFPSGRTKTYSRPGAPCAVIGLMPDLARTPPGRDVTEPAMLWDPGARPPSCQASAKHLAQPGFRPFGDSSDATAMGN